MSSLAALVAAASSVCAVLCADVVPFASVAPFAATVVSADAVSSPEMLAATAAAPQDVPPTALALRAADALSLVVKPFAVAEPL